MNSELLDNYIEKITNSIIDPMNFPEIISSENIKGFVMPKSEDNWMNIKDFSKTIEFVSRKNNTNSLLIVEDFERIFKNTGAKVRLHKVINRNWNDFEKFTSENDMISYYIFDEVVNWCAWFNDEYWCFFCPKELYCQLDESYRNANNALSSFKDSDEEFKLFIMKIYGSLQ